MAKKQTAKKVARKKPPVKTARKKAAAKKATVKKTPAPKAGVKKSVGQTPAKAVKKSSSKKSTPTPSTKKPAKKTPVVKKRAKPTATASKSAKSSAKPKPKKQAGAGKPAAKKTASKATVKKPKNSVSKKGAAKTKEKQLRADLIEKIRERREDRTGEDSVTQTRSGPGTFTIEDVRRILRESSGEKEAPKATKKRPKETPKKEKEKPPQPKGSDEPPVRPPQTFGAVSMADILGFDPHSNADQRQKQDESSIPKKYLPYYRELLRMRDSLSEQIDLHSEESQILSKQRDGSGSAYSQHLADAGTDTFDIDFALSLVSSEQEALSEINDAIARMRKGTYGICEITGKPISKQRLKAVPFTRYSVEGQQEVERNKRKTTTRTGGVFGTSAEDVAAFSESDDE